MSHPIKTPTDPDQTFKRSLIQSIDPTFAEDDRATIDGTFEAIILQLLQHYQQSPEFKELEIPEIGDTVTWKYGKGQGVGKVQKIYSEPVTLTLKDSPITRNGTPENPALLILQDSTRVLKLASEVKRSQEVDFENEVAIAFSFDFDGRYDHIDLTPTKGMREAARQAIVYIESGFAGDGLEPETVRWVRKVSRGEPISIEKAKKGYKFFKRHNYYKKTQDKGDTNPNQPAPWYVARMAWFGDDGEKFFNRVWRQIQAEDTQDFAEDSLDFGCIIHKIIKWNGLDIGVEYRPGDIRFKGSKHQRKIRSGYGHCRGYVGADKEALDVYLCPEYFKPDGEPSDRIFEVSQLSMKAGSFDEHKYMIGYQDLQEAKAAYLSEMPEKAFGDIREVDRNYLEQFHRDRVKRSCSDGVEVAIAPTVGFGEVVDFDGSGLKVKSILEDAYKDGISGLENVLVDGDTITGIFLDRISPTVTKRFTFKITPDTTTFKLDDADQNFSEYLEFAKSRKNMVGAKTGADKLGRVKTCNPDKSFPCGKTCRPNGGNCRFKNSPESQNLIKEVLSSATVQTEVTTKPEDKKDRQTLSTASSTGEVVREGNKVYKSALVRGQETLEGEVYAELQGVDGIMQGKSVEKDGQKMIETPYYSIIVSIDDIPQDQRENAKPLISKNIDRINLAVASLSEAGYAYNDPLQFGYKDGKLDLFDFSNVDKPQEKRRNPTNENYNLLGTFYKQFGLGEQAAIISSGMRLKYNYNHYKNTPPDLIWIDGVELDQLNEIKKKGIPAENIYYSTNARAVQLKNVGQTEPVDGVKYIVSAEPLTDAEKESWELRPIFEKKRKS